MTEKQTNKERLKDITDSIERGIQDLFQSDNDYFTPGQWSRLFAYNI